ncbi:MAG: AAA family ATPase [Candidatus Limnocylindria bacterium]
MTISLPAGALVLMVGISGSGKTTFASRHFRATQVLSSDALRAMIADDPTAQNATDDAFDLLHRLLEMRLRRGRLTVVDATNVEEWARRELVAFARRHRRPVVAIVLDLPFETLLERNAARSDRPRPRAALTRQARWLRDSLLSLPNEGLDAVHRLGSTEEVDAVRVVAPRG